MNKIFYFVLDLFLLFDRFGEGWEILGGNRYIGIYNKEVELVTCSFDSFRLGGIVFFRGYIFFF